ncbi:MAG: septum formation inhibitor Maf [Melioribacteraceae bacterium]|nr:septum formation inhibitor Maf [Melioribacteraceae bacterium]
MIDTNLPIYLASKSPRRKKLLKQIGLEFRTLTFDFEEKLIPYESPVIAVKRLAAEKMNEANSRVKSDAIIITADTIVMLDGTILGKPKSKIDAKRMLRMLSGRTHLVYTGFGVMNTSNNKLLIRYEKTSVTFRNLMNNEINDYVETGSPLDKAGAYGIQDDFGAVFVSKINGCYYNVVGLPLANLYKSLEEVM